MEQPDVLGRRIGAAIIDLGIVILIALLVGGIFGSDVGPDAPASSRYGAGDRLLIIVLVFGYYWATEAFMGGQTLGKRVLGIRVVRVDGSPAGPGAIFVRTLLRVVDGILVYLVAFISVFATGPRRQRLGDLAAKTRVVAADAPTDAPPTAPPPPPSDEDVLVADHALTSGRPLSAWIHRESWMNPCCRRGPGSIGGAPAGWTPSKAADRRWAVIGDGDSPRGAVDPGSGEVRAAAAAAPPDRGRPGSVARLHRPVTDRARRGAVRGEFLPGAGEHVLQRRTLARGR